MKTLEKVLLVDDDATARFLMERILKKGGIGQHILTATNGAEALTLLHQVCFTTGCPELILLDINKPLMNGFEFLQALKDSPLANLEIQIIMLTSSANPRDIAQAHQFAINGYLQKPLTLEKLQTALAA